ncbi:Predicted ribosomal protein [uncultured Ruminococcus sp.]|nr:Predicted ribosomal protein [uncultured Clostridium sp.]SCH75981.1 Predicted ribosomal protein [uncultured Ruminococcus sp.]
MIVIRRQTDGITVTGHAGYAEPGKDIVCAAVSALLQTFIESVDKQTTGKLKCDIRAGNALVRYGNLSADVKLLLDSFFIGVQMIADAYPDYVRVIV